MAVSGVVQSLRREVRLLAGRQGVPRSRRSGARGLKDVARDLHTEIREDCFHNIYGINHGRVDVAGPA
jgi:hypothetical protein